jgi:hypothetical protein
MDQVLLIHLPSISLMWVKQCHFYHSWLGMVNIPIKMVQITLFFTHINGTIILISNTSNKKSNHIIHIVKLLTLLLLYTLILTVTDILTCSYYWLLLLVD